MLFRLKMSIDEAINAYVELAGQVFSEKKWFFQTGSFKATRLEAATLRVIKRALNIESDDDAWRVPLLDNSSPKWYVS